MKILLPISIIRLSLALSIWLYTGFESQPTIFQQTQRHEYKLIQNLSTCYDLVNQRYISIVHASFDKFLFSEYVSYLPSFLSAIWFDTSIGIGQLKSVRLNRLLLPIKLTQAARIFK